MRSRRGLASIASRFAGAISSPRRRCPTAARSARLARRSYSIPAIMPGCSTRRSPPSTGASCRTIYAGAAVLTGEATRRAASAVRTKALDVAAELLQQAAEDLDIVDGRVVRKAAAAGPSIALGQLAQALEPTSKLLGTRSPGLSAEGWFHSDHMNYPYGVHVVVAKIDRETGGVTLERYLVAYDVGRAVNPMLVEGQ